MKLLRALVEIPRNILRQMFDLRPPYTPPHLQEKDRGPVMLVVWVAGIFIYILICAYLGMRIWQIGR